MPNSDREILRKLAARWMELASLPVMAERKRRWTALKDLHPERPMLLFETTLLVNYVADSELECRDTSLRPIERWMRWAIRHVEEVNDDLVLEPHYRVYWDIELSDYGVEIHDERAVDDHGDRVAVIFTHPIQTPADIAKLKPRTWKVDREKTRQRMEQLSDIFGDILPVKLQGLGSPWAGLTCDLFKLIGNDNLLMWTYDAPEALHQLMAYLRDDRLTYYRWLEEEGLLELDNNAELAGSGSPGFTTYLPKPGYTGKTRLCDKWVWLESQETTMISPAMFKRFFLPYIADVGKLFGLVYYGCCEPVHDRWDSIIQAIPNIRAVSISPWCDQKIMAEKLGKKVVFSRKPKPWLISGDSPDWDGLAQDLDETLAAARDGNLEFIYRDVYRIADRRTLRRWTDLARSRIG